jgi:hypothetical protein
MTDVDPATQPDTASSGPTPPSGTADGPAAGARSADDADQAGHGSVATSSEAEAGPTAEPAAEPAGGSGWSARLPGWLVIGGLLAILVGPLLVALGVLHDPRPYPLADLAMIEMRVRDVFSSHPPLVGAPGRLDGFGVGGSHLGPLAFYALAPVYWLMGGTAWGLNVAVVVVDAVALGLCLWVARRRGGPVVALGMAATLVVVLRSYGPHELTEPWNPFLVLLWWIVFLLAVWCVLCDDLALLPLAVFAGSYCIQGHVPYVPLVGSLGGLAVAGVALHAFRHRSEPGARRRPLLWGGASVAVGVAVWALPLYQQVTNSPGNIAVVIENFRHPLGGEEPIGLGTGLDLWLARIDPVQLLTGDTRAGSWSARLGAVALLAAWAGIVALAWKRRDALAHGADLLRLHLVVAAALLVGFVSLSRIIGVPWFYLHMWALGITALLVLATGWTAVELLADRRASAGREAPARQATSTDPWARALVGGLAVVLVVVAGMFAVDAAYTEVPVARMASTLRAVAPDTIAALKADDAPGGGEDGKYLVRWVDPIGVGEPGWGLVDELEREGLHPYLDRFQYRGAREHRLLDEVDATAIVHVVGGPAIDDYRALPGVIELAYTDQRTPAEKAEFDELRADVQADIDAAGLTDEIDLDGSLFGIAQNRALSQETRDALGKMIDLGVPLAVFVEPRG